MTPDLPALDAISIDAPSLPLPVVSEAVEVQFGLTGDFSPLVSERDQNFRLRVNDGRQFLVKVTSALEPAATTDFQIGALLFLEDAADVIGPRVVLTSSGKPSGEVKGDQQAHSLRVLTWTEGAQLETGDIDGSVAEQLGQALARLDRGLHGYTHPGEKPVLLWDLQRARELRGILHHIDDEAVRDTVAGVVDDYEHNVIPALSGLRQQVIHGDANPGNVLVSEAGIGIIDFGDTVKAPLVFDLAIAASYLRSFGPDPASLITSLVAGYHAVLPLKEIEGVLLYDLIRARLATTVTLLYWRVGARPANDPYRQKTLEHESSAQKFLTALETLGRSAFTNKIIKLLNQGPSKVS